MVKKKYLKPPSQNFTATLNGPISIGEEHLPIETWEDMISRPNHWLRKATELLRAANILARQALRDEEERRANPQSAHRFDVWDQAYMLAAMSIEDGLKAFVAQNVTPLTFSKGKTQLPDELASHVLPDLLSCANERSPIQVNPQGPHEIAAIAQGERFITHYGRYPTTRDARENPRDVGFETYAIVPAYNRLFLRIDEAVARIEHRKTSAPAHFTEDEFVRHWSTSRNIEWMDQPKSIHITMRLSAGAAPKP